MKHYHFREGTYNLPPAVHAMFPLKILCKLLDAIIALLI